MSGFFGWDLDLGAGQGGAGAAQGDDMAVKSKTITLAEINAAATPSGAIAALSFNVTDVVNLTTAGFKTDIDAADDQSAQNALRLLIGQPWPVFGGTTITIAGTAGYNGVHEIASNGVVSSGGKLAFKTNTALGGTESGLTATAVFTKLACFSFALPTLPANNMLLNMWCLVLGAAAGGATSIPTVVNYLKADGLQAQIANGPNLTVANSEVNLMNVGRIASTAAQGPLDRTLMYASVHCNQEAGKQLDDITGLDDGAFFSVAYVEVNP